MSSLRSWMVNTSSECSQYLFGCMLTGTGVYVHWYWSVDSLRPQCKLIATDYDTVKNQILRRAMCISLNAYKMIFAIQIFLLIHLSRIGESRKNQIVRQ